MPTQPHDSMSLGDFFTSACAAYHFLNIDLFVSAMNGTRQFVGIAALLVVAFCAFNHFYVINPLFDTRHKVERYIQDHFGWITAVKLVKPPFESLQCISPPDRYSVPLKKGYSYDLHKSKVASAVDLDQATYVSFEASQGHFVYAASLNNTAFRAVYDDGGVEYMICDGEVVPDD